MKLALCQMNIIQGDQSTNRETAELMIRQAAKSSAEVIVLPEMWTSGYDFANLNVHKEPVTGSTYRLLGSLAKELGVYIVGGSHPVEYSTGVRNTSLTFAPDGTLVNEYSKIHLIGLMAEDQYLQPGIDFNVFEIENHKAAVQICYDLRFTELPRSYALMGAKILFIPAEWPIQREEHWVALLKARAIENQMFVVGVNTAGKNENDVFNGHSMVIDPWGTVLLETSSEPGVFYADVDLNLADEVRAKIPVFKDRKPKIYKL